MFLKPSNIGWYQKGHLQNVRRGDELEDGEESLIGDLVITDEHLISRVESGDVRECSLGYNCSYWPRGDGSFEQRDILINHIAVVSAGRAGDSVRIMDSKEDDVNWEPINRRLDAMIEALTRATGGKTRTTSDAKRTLVDEINEIKRGARRVEELSRPGGPGPSGFAAALREHNRNYDEFSSEQERGQKFADEAKAAGEAMAARFRPKDARVCRNPVTPVNDSEEDWAETVNRRGRAMRK
jgi:hypothetical protein